MKKITLFSFLGVAFVVATSLYAKEQRIWTGATNKLWDLANPNWSDPNSVLSFLPTTTVDSATAFFDDNTDSLKVKVVGTMIADSIVVNSSKNYLIDVNATGAEITGKGILIKKGTGTFEMNVKNSLLGGTIIYEGKVKMLNQTSPNAFGAKLVLNGGTANFATTTSSTYPSVTLPVEIPAGKTGIVELSRYSYWSSPITGSGDLQIYAAGERTYLGQKNVPPVWTAFTGNVKVDKYTGTGVVPGFYGLLFNSNKTYKDTLTYGKGVDSVFYNRRLTLGTGTTIGAESGTRAYAIGELVTTDSTNLIAGYYKDSTTPQIFYYIGGLNTSVIFPGRIGYIGTKAYNLTGIVKVGTGTYTFTNNDNQMTAGLSVREGRVLICDKNIKGSKNGGTGYSVNVRKNGTIGGTGRIAGNVDVYGTLQPGADGIGTLLLSDSITAKTYSKYGTPFKYSFTYKPTATTSSTYSFQVGGTRAVDLTLREGSVSEFEIGSATSYDKVIATGKIRFSKDTLSAGKPKLKIKLASGYNIKDGDKFEIITAKSLDAANSNGFDIEYPTANGITWTVDTKADTTKLDKEVITFTNKVTTYTMTDSMAVTNVTPDTMKISYHVVLTASVKTGLAAPTTKNTISVYPNPTRGNVNFTSSDAEITSIEIINIQGQVIMRKEMNSTTVQLNLDKLSSGVYYTKVSTAKGTKVDKLVVQ
ncbi:MAG: T9SS type A sorting domain-containing protein [Paludibacter sp.]|nr:T9SS type A sorting domain-containing protein [Paludibacter sp.]